MTYPILEKACEVCGSIKTTQVINAGNKLRVGWYCPDCRHMTLSSDEERTLNEQRNEY